jgi:hypothetical protein
MEHMSRPLRALSGAILVLMVASGASGQSQTSPVEGGDPLLVRIQPSVVSGLRARRESGGIDATGVPPRLIVFFCETEGPLGDSDPFLAPFHRRPQPIRSIPIDLRRLLADEGSTVFELGDGIEGVACVPERIADLDGTFRLRAVLDLGSSRGHDAPGNPISETVEVEYRRDRIDPIEIVIDDLGEDEPSPAAENLVWVDIPSPILTRKLGRPVAHRAGVALPPAYFDPNSSRRFWPVVYVIPGFGGDERGAERWARLLADPNMSSAMPEAIFIVLDPNDPLGHHGFIDGDNMGPRGTALVDEFIPWLEKRFRLVSDASGRIVHGHSSGGWSSLWLQIEHPATFGACFASAPDPVDFSAFGTVDMLNDENLFVGPGGEVRASYRARLSPGIDRILMTVREEVAMEHAMAPDGTSGEQWSAWNAMFSSRNRATGRPLMAIDLESGRIDRTIVARDWSRFDITARLRRAPERIAPILLERVRLLCGTRDCYYLDEAVSRLSRELEGTRERLGLEPGSGSIELVPDATHDSITGHAMRRWLPEMRRITDELPLP